jgi:hypothetical protein
LHRTRPPRLARALTLGFVLFVTVLARPALAVDGVIEINQARALAGSVSPGDGAGFPISLNQRASYRLTSNLDVPFSTDGIEVNVDDVTIDLNGFSIVSAGGPFFDGINGARSRTWKSTTAPSAASAAAGSSRIPRVRAGGSSAFVRSATGSPASSCRGTSISSRTASPSGTAASDSGQGTGPRCSIPSREGNTDLDCS